MGEIHRIVYYLGRVSGSGNETRQLGKSGPESIQSSGEHNFGGELQAQSDLRRSETVASLRRNTDGRVLNFVSLSEHVETSDVDRDQYRLENGVRTI